MFEGGLKDEHLHVGGLFPLRREMRLLSLKTKYITVPVEPGSIRSQDPGQRRVLDRAARQRRINRQLEALENDNFQDDPHAGLPQLGKRLPQFDDDADTGKKKKKTRGDHFKLRFRKNFQALLEEQNLSMAEGPNYLTACAGPPSRPQRPFCAVCGFPSPYTCVSCGARYCTVRCLGTHQETRCLKWTV
ncbi:zinc finger HIT domain-containing protein 1 isoform X1 [Equus quagga]|uniref:zinc finger HIT domain-containing protein 1 isoform X1 n=1 Tax=Equus quagga TaxID=89248 RepID=UPI001EE28694|nr:zinc finger HIT domain-containing protein 1 isoform X1 [Equus quagga]